MFKNKALKLLAPIGVVAIATSPICLLGSCNINSQPEPEPEPVDNDALIIENGVLVGYREDKLKVGNTIDIPTSCTSIKKEVFKNVLTKTSSLSNIVYISIPSTVTQIGDEAFAGCDSVIGLALPNRTSIPNWTGKDIFKGWNTKGKLYKGKDKYLDNTNLFEYFMYQTELGSWIPDIDWKCQRYISDRTFSLMGISEFITKYTCITTPSKHIQDEEGYSINWGTTWILSDATPNNHTDFQYYVATNWHVKAGMDSLQTNHTDYAYDEDNDKWQIDSIYKSNTYSPFYGDITTQKKYYGADGLSWQKTHKIDSRVNNPDYIELKTTSIVWEDISNFITNQTYDSGNKVKAVDFYVAKIDFNNLAYGEVLPTSIQTKLNNINKWNTIHDGINKLATYNSDTINADKYVGGFPVDDSTKEERYDSSISRWENHQIKSNEYKVEQPNISSAHNVDDPQNKYYDWSKQYTCKDEYEKKPTWMDGGASGSMLITQDLELCGIYWGGMVNNPQTPTKFWPSFSVLNDTSYKDFITKYI